MAEFSRPVAEEVGRPARGAEALFVEFVAGRDVPCPRCAYNLRDLTAPACPECRTRLELCVGRQHTPHGLFLLAIAPGVFCGVLLCALLTAIVYFGQFDRPPPALIALMSLWIASGILALVLIRLRTRFVRLSTGTQALVAAILWTLHVAAFFVFLHFA